MGGDRKEEKKRAEEAPVFTGREQKNRKRSSRLTINNKVMVKRELRIIK